jgi:hypothetical protein
MIYAVFIFWIDLTKFLRLRISYDAEQVERIERLNLAKSNSGSAVHNKIYCLSQRVAIAFKKSRPERVCGYSY